MELSLKDRMLLEMGITSHLERNDAKDDDVQWITVKGTHIPLDEEGNMTGKIGEKIENSEKKSSGEKSKKNSKEEVKETYKDPDTGKKIEFMSKRKSNDFISKIRESDLSDEEKNKQIGDFLRSLPVGSKVSTPAHWNDDGISDVLVWDGTSWATKKRWENGGWSCPTDELAYYFTADREEERPLISSIAETPEERKEWAEQQEKSYWKNNEQVWQKGAPLSQKETIKLRKLDLDNCGVGTVVIGSDGRKYIKDYDGFEKGIDGKTEVTKYSWRDLETYNKADKRVLKSPSYEGDFYDFNFGLNGVSEVECSRMRTSFDSMPEEMKPVYEKVFREGKFTASVPTPYDPEPGSFFSPADRNVHFGKNATAETIVHECSHAYDDVSLKVEVDLPYGGKRTIRSASVYLDHLAGSSEDQKEDFEAMAKVFGFKTDGEGWFSKEYGETNNFETCMKLHMVYNRGCAAYTGIEGFECVSDAVSGLTMDACFASLIHGGHEKDYWMSPYGGDKASSRSTEYWANYCLLRSRNCGEALDLLKKITPKMYSAAEKAYREVFGNGA